MALYFPLINNSQLIFKEEFKLKGAYTVYIQILPAVMNAIFGIFFGKLIDIYGKRMSFAILSGIFVVSTYSLTLLIQRWFLLDHNSIFALLYMLFLGSFWSLFTVFELPCMSIVVNQ